MLVPVGILAYGIFLAGRFGDPMISVRQQEEYWGRTFVSPVATLQGAWNSAVDGAGYWLRPVALFTSSSPAPSLEASNTVNLAFFALLLVLLGIGFVVLPPGLSLYTFVIMVLPILTPSPIFPLMSLPRFMLGAFPLFLVLGYVLARNRTALVVWLAFSIVGGVAADRAVYDVAVGGLKGSVAQDLDGRAAEERTLQPDVGFRYLYPDGFYTGGGSPGQRPLSVRRPPRSGRKALLRRPRGPGDGLLCSLQSP